MKRILNAPCVLLFFMGTIFFTGSACLRNPSVSKVMFCDDYETSCTAPMESSHKYDITVPEKKAASWRDLAYHMYFHTRQTPGIRLDYRPRLSSEQIAALRQDGHCEWKLSRGGKSVQGHLEGRRIDEDGGGVWCFDYLGTMLIEYQKKHGSLTARPDPAFFPAEITLGFRAANAALSAELSGTVEVHWTLEGAEKK